MAFGLSVCWLFPGEPGSFPEPFVPALTDVARFETWYRVLFSGQGPTPEHLILTKETYSFVRTSNANLFDFDCTQSEPLLPLHQRLRADVYEYFKDLISCYDIVTRSTDPVMITNCFARILIFVDFSSIKYQRNFIGLIIPIFHVFFYGIWGSESIRYDFDTIESITASAFVRFLSAPPFTFLKLTSDSQQLSDFTTRFLLQARNFQLFQAHGNISTLPFLRRWIRHLFSDELDLGDLIRVWDWILHSLSTKTFLDAVAAMCAAIAIEMRSECECGFSEELISVLEDLTKVPIDLVLARVETL
jgi:hypothetical protein